MKSLAAILTYWILGPVLAVIGLIVLPFAALMDLLDEKKPVRGVGGPTHDVTRPRTQSSPEHPAPLS